MVGSKFLGSKKLHHIAAHKSIHGCTICQEITFAL